MSTKGLGASIWAPQPQSPDGCTGWPHTSTQEFRSHFQSCSIGVSESKSMRSILIADSPPATNDDVFGSSISKNTSYNSNADAKQQAFLRFENNVSKIFCTSIFMQIFTLCTKCPLWELF